MNKIFEKMRTILEKMDKIAEESAINRWRALGLLEGLRPNSEIEKRVATNFERMAKYLVSDKYIQSETSTFETVIFPILRRIEKCESKYNKTIKRSVEAEEVIDVLKNNTFKDVEDVIKTVIPKKRYESKTKYLFNVIKYKGLYDQSVFDFLYNYDDICSDHSILSDEEKKFFCGIFELNGIDMLAELTAMFCDLLVDRLKN